MWAVAADWIHGFGEMAEPLGGWEAENNIKLWTCSSVAQ